MATKEISIIIPCYNCEKTLREAVESCYRQGLREFEIVMVDDGSTDGTRALMDDLASKHSNIRCAYHEKNKGGGATRNTAVAHAKSEVIFCLDSDDMLAPGTLAKMLDLQQEKGCDGVGIHLSIKFRGTDPNNIEKVDTFSFAGEIIPIESLLQKGDTLCPLYSTFMYTKESFGRAGGYPTSHGFDTQGFAWRFLASGGVAYTCPDATYLHRIHFSESYYMREWAQGKTNHNWFDILDEQFSLFDQETQALLLSFDLSDGTKNLFDTIRLRESVFRNDLKNVATPGGRVTLLESLKGENALGPLEAYWLGSELMRAGEWADAKTALGKARAGFPASACVAEKIFAVDLRLKGTSEAEVSARIARRRKYVGRKSIKGVFLRIMARTRRALAPAYLAIQDIATRARSPHPLSLIFGRIRLSLQKMLRVRFESPEETATEMIDVVIPTIMKDYALLETSLEGIRANIGAKIGTIHVAAPKSDQIERFCLDHGLNFIDEQSVLGFGPKSIEYRVNGVDRRGWLFQQLLKLGADSFVRTSSYIVVDSDTVLLRKHPFVQGAKRTFFESTGWHEPYMRTFEKLFGYETPNRRSYVSHMMIFDKAHLTEMKAEMEAHTGTTWIKAILGTIDQSEHACFSEYETYANWLSYRHPEAFVSVPFYNLSISRRNLLPLPKLTEKYSRKAWSVSFHGYL